MSSKIQEERIKEVLEPFRNRLTIEEESSIIGARSGFSQRIIWRKLGDLLFAIAFPLLESAMFRSGKGNRDWCKSPLTDSLLPAEKKALLLSSRSKLRQKYIVMLLMKKALGVLKQRLNKELEEIRPLSGTRENAYFEAIEQALEVNTYFDEDIIELLEKHMGVEDRSRPCPHTGQTRIVLESTLTGHYKRTICQECNQVLNENWQSSAKAKEESTEHVHNPRWVKGKEGKEAVCLSCEETIEDPSQYNWVGAGLEPFGDDPSQDEIIFLGECEEE